MSFRLTRHPSNPVMVPDLTSDWECYNVFNPSVIHHNGLFHMHYRAQGLDWVSRIGYAVSVDGVHWNRLRHPVLEPVDGTDSRGVEDARVTLIDGIFYMTYTAYGREFHGSGDPTIFGGGITPMIARSENLITWAPQRTDPLAPRAMGTARRCAERSLQQRQRRGGWHRLCLLWGRRPRDRSGDGELGRPARLRPLWLGASHLGVPN